MTRRLVGLLVLALCASGPRVAAQQVEGPAPLRILIVDDDGYLAGGLLALVDSLLPMGEIFVAAPLQQQSGTGHGITYREPMAIVEHPNAPGVPWFAVDARPATVTNVAVLALMEERPDVVVSGINRGDNVGASAWVSGTVAAARQAAMLGIPAVAFSTNVRGEGDYSVAAGWARRVLEALARAGALEAPLLLNVNIPMGEPLGIRVAPMSLDLGTQQYEERRSPRGLRYVWDSWAAPDSASDGTDLDWFGRGYVTVTPLALDQTDRARLVPLEAVFEGLAPRP